MLTKSPLYKKFVSLILLVLLVLPATIFQRTPVVYASIFGEENIPLYGNWVTNIKNTVESTIQTATEIKEWTHESVLGPLAVQMANLAIQKITQDTVKWASGGFYGEPLYISNFKQYYESIQDTEALYLKDQLAGDSDTGYNRSILIAMGKKFVDDNKYELGENLLNFTLDQTINNSKACKVDNQEVRKLLQDFETDYRIENPNASEDEAKQKAQEQIAKQFTKVKDGYIKTKCADWTQYGTDFAIGGWEAYASIAANPNNTPYGAQFAAEQLLAQRLTSAVANEREKLLSDGFKPEEECVKFHTASPSSQDSQNSQNNQSSQGGQGGPESTEGAQAGAGAASSSSSSSTGTLSDERTRKCLKSVILTPSKIVEGNLQAALSAPLEKVIKSDDFASIISSSLAQIAGAAVQGGLKRLGDFAMDRYSSYSEMRTQVVSAETAASSDFEFTGTEGVTIDVFKELYGDSRIIDEDGNNIPNTDRPDTPTGAIEINAREVALLSDQQELLQEFPRLFMELDHCLPGPDKGFEDRFRNTFNSNRKLMKKRQDAASNTDKADEIAELDFARLNVLQAMQTLNMGIKEGSFPNITIFPTIQGMLGQTENIAQRRSELNRELSDSITRASKIAVLRNMYTSDPEGNRDQIAQQLYSMRDSMPTLNRVGLLESQNTAYTQQKQELENLISQCKVERTYPVNNTLVTLDEKQALYCGYLTNPDDWETIVRGTKSTTSFWEITLAIVTVGVSGLIDESQYINALDSLSEADMSEIEKFSDPDWIDCSDFYKSSVTEYLDSQMPF